MSLTRDEVVNILKSRGLSLREVKSPDYTVIQHNGETVGVVYDDSVYVAENYPSLNYGQSKSYADSPKTIVMFTKPRRLLEDAIDWLFDSPRRIDSEMRVKRVENMKKYFEQKKMEERLEKAWEEVPSWRNLSQRRFTDEL